METTPNEPTVQSEQLRRNPISSMQPLGIFIAALACMDCVLGFLQSRTLLGASTSDRELFVAFVASSLGIAQYAVAIVLGGLVFRRWIVGVTVAVFIAVFWLCSFLCWQFPIFWQNTSAPNRFLDLLNAVCLVPVTVFAGCFPLLLIRVGMLRARPKGNSIVELFAITSFFASVVVVTRLGSMSTTVGDLAFYLVMTALGSAIFLTPASLLYFMAKDRTQGTQRFTYFASAVSALLSILPMIAGLVSLLPLVWLLIVCTTLLLGLHCMHLSGLRIPNELSAPDELTVPPLRNDRAQFIGVIISSIVAAFCINLFVAMISTK